MTRDRGAADVLGLVLLAPVALGLAMLVVHVGRQVDARAQVQSVAELAAQAAVRQRTPAAARHAAIAVLDAQLVDDDTCARRDAIVDLSRFVPGGEVAVSVTCTVARRGVELIAPPARELTATAWAALDPHRAVAP